MSNERASRIDINRTVAEAYAFMRGAVGPTILGTLTYAMTSVATALIIKYQLLGAASYSSAVCLYGFMALSWFSMALRRGTGQPEKGIFGMTFGMDEIRLGLSAGLAAIALGLVAFFIGFALFLISMSTVILDSGLTGNDSEEALTAYLEAFTLTDAGIAARLIVLSAASIALGGFLYLLVRVLPFAPGSIAMRKITALQSVAWTKYQGRNLLAAFVGTFGVALLVAAALQWGFSQLPGPSIIGMLGSHMVGCFAALIGVGFVSSAYTQLQTNS